MNHLPAFDNDLLKKMNILSILRDQNEQEALRIYPELEWYVLSCRGKNYEESKTELLRETQMDLVSR